MRAVNSSIGLATAALAGLAFVLPAQAIEIDLLLGPAPAVMRAIVAREPVD